jgi:hypothetical protein
MVFELGSGKTARVSASGVSLLAFHPTMPDLVLTAAGPVISFWQLDTDGPGQRKHDAAGRLSMGE